MRVLAGLLLQALVLAHAAQPVQGVASYASGAPTPLQPPPEPLSLPPIAAKPQAQRTCLVLSGGGARGMAHIGVLRVLEELRVPVDCVVGTSMGAIIGGAWASGVSLDRLEKTIRAANWDVVLADQPERPRRSLRFKELERLRSAGTGAELGVRGFRTVLPAGAVIGQQLESFLQALLGPSTTQASFDDLGVPFRAIATDIESGRMTVIDHGSLNAAVRASMSVPGVFAPLQLNGRLLVDGGLVRNLGVDVARQMGATRIIAVNLGTPLSGRNELGSLIGVTGQMINILTEQNVAASLAQLRPADILIAPDLEDFSAADFARAWTMIEMGERAARAVAGRLAEWSLSPAEYVALRARAAGGRGVPMPAGSVRVATDALQHVNPESVRAVFNEALGGQTDVQAVSRAVDALYATDDFRQVSVRTELVAGRDDIVIEPREKDWGPDYLRLGLTLSTDLAGESAFSIGAEYRRTWLNRRGLEWRTLGSAGAVTGLRSELIQPVDIARRWMAAVYAQGDQRLDEYFVGDESVSRFRNRIGRIGGEGRRQFSTDAELRLGYRRSWFEAATVTGFELPDRDGRSAEFYANLVVDRLDNWDFPRHGTFLQGTLSAADEALGGEFTYRKFGLNMQRAFGRDRHSLSMLLRYGNSLGSKLPLFDAFELGGFQNLSGFNERQILANRLMFGRVVYGYQIGTAGTLSRGLYVGGSLEAAEVHDRLNGPTDRNALFAGSLFVAADTALGPFYLGVGTGEGGERALYLFLGRP